MIKKLIDPSGKLSCEVGKDDVIKIELTNHGNDKTTIFRVSYKNGDYEFYGLPEYEVE